MFGKNTPQQVMLVHLRHVISIESAESDKPRVLLLLPLLRVPFSVAVSLYVIRHTRRGSRCIYTGHIFALIFIRSDFAFDVTIYRKYVAYDICYVASCICIL